MKPLELEDLRCYQLAQQLSGIIWQTVIKWKIFEKDTIGKQFVRATDSIGANLAEGYGRYHYLDTLKFYYYARGSIYESKYWHTLALKRQLLTKAENITIQTILNNLPQNVNALIKHTRTTQNRQK